MRCSVDHPNCVKRRSLGTYPAKTAAATRFTPVGEAEYKKGPLNFSEPLSDR